MADCPTISLNPDKCERVTFRRHFRTGSREQVRFGERQVGGQDQRGVFVAAGDELEEQVGRVLLEGDVANLVDLSRHRDKSTYADPVTMPTVVGMRFWNVLGWWSVRSYACRCCRHS